jgi:L-rhamnose mutarotase
MRRVCFQLQVRPDRIPEYRARHEAVWPDMLRALAATGWHNYSLFLREDGLLIGYFETPSLSEAVAGMAALEVNQRWQQEMAEFFVGLDDVPPDQGFRRLDEVFHLEDQLQRADESIERPRDET